MMSRLGAGAALAILLGSGAECLADPARPPGQQACAAFDLHVLTLVEDHGAIEGAEPEPLVAAVEQMAAAREACRRGDVRLGLTLYEGVQLAHARPTVFHSALKR